MTWISAADERDLFLSVLTIGEIRSGVVRVQDPVRRARLETFVFAITERFASRTLLVDLPVATRWGVLTAELAQRGLKAPAIDSLLAATALQHDLTIVTRNDAHFHAASVPVLNPFT